MTGKVIMDRKREFLEEQVGGYIVGEKSHIIAELVSCVFVPGSCHYSGTNTLGVTQRRIIDFLATAPSGFCDIKAMGFSRGRRGDPNTIAMMQQWPKTSHALEHSAPAWTAVSEITTAVYSTDNPTAAQTRGVQRAVRRLETLGLVDCMMWCDMSEKAQGRSYTTRLGFTAWQPTPALYARLTGWSCKHVKARHHRMKREYLVDMREDERYRQERQALAGLDPAEALMQLVGHLG